jgi:hypothetical protein
MNNAEADKQVLTESLSNAYRVVDVYRREEREIALLIESLFKKECEAASLATRFTPDIFAKTS